MLTERVAKTIVNKTLSLMDININIFNTKAIIIASGDEMRIGSFHEGAKRCIEANSPVEANWDVVGQWQGVRHSGISLPIILNNEIVGAVGVTGELEVVKNYAKLVKITVELLLEQQLNDSQREMEERAKENLILVLVEGRYEQDTEFELKAHQLGLKFELSYIVVLIDLCTNSNQNLNHRNIYNVIEKIIEKIINPMDIIGFIYSKYLVIFKYVNNSKKIKEIKQFGNIICDRLTSALGNKTRIGIGEPYSGYEGIKKSFDEAMLALKLGELTFKESPYFINQFIVEELLSQTVMNAKQKFTHQTLKKLIEENAKTKDLIDTLKVFLNCNLSTTETSLKMYFHRNTVLNRLKKIEQITGLNPFEFTDAVKLYLAIACFELMGLSTDSVSNKV